MMKLNTYYNQLQTPEKTDKGTAHDYIEGYYSEVFSPIREKNINLLEIGVALGYSFDLWRGWFPNASLVSIDIETSQHVIDRINTVHNSKGFVQDAFTQKTLDLFEDNFFDFIIEDGPHSVETQLFASTNWVNKLKVGGKLIIEDIQNPDHDVPLIIAPVENNTNYEIKLFDLRPNKGRYDDYIIEITKLK